MNFQDERVNQQYIGGDSKSIVGAVWVQPSDNVTLLTGPDNSTAETAFPNRNTSPLSSSSNGNAEMRSNDSGDAEGVWSPDIDQAFHEALQIYPPCGRRKIILSDEGKMYGRNELIARYIKIRCGKTRTRKQVSSHIQVLARKKQREEHAKVKVPQENPSASASLLNQQQLPAVSSTCSPLSPNSQQGIPKPDSPAIIGPFSSNSLCSQPLNNLLTGDQSSTSRKQITSVQAQMLKMASIGDAISQNWSCHLRANNLINNFTDPMGISSANSQSIGLTIQPNFALKTESNQILPDIDRNNIDVMDTQTTSIDHDYSIASSKLMLNGFVAFIEQNFTMQERIENRIEIVHIPKISDAPVEKIGLDLIQSKYPAILQELFDKGPADAFFLAKCWANTNFEIDDELNSLFAVDSFYESSEKFDIVVSTKVCSFGNEVVEKVEIYSPIDDEEEAKSSGIWHFRLEKSPMCEYMVRFISELKKLQQPALMNSVLENFTVLQIVSNNQDKSTLMVIAFIFEVREDGDDEISTNIYRLTESSNT